MTTTRNVPGGGPVPLLARAIGLVPKRRISINGQSFSVTSTSLAITAFPKLGLARERYKRGFRIYLLDTQGYAKLARACGFDKPPNAFFPLHRENDFEAVLRQQVDVLAGRSRVIILPEGSADNALTHELLHDIYFGGGLSPQERRDFVDFILFHYQDTIGKGRSSPKPDQAFYAKVARLCAERYQIELIEPADNPNRYLGDIRFALFASECFAHAGEHVIEPKTTIFPNIPGIVTQKLKELRLFRPDILARL